MSPTLATAAQWPNSTRSQRPEEEGGAGPAPCLTRPLRGVVASCATGLPPTATNTSCTCGQEHYGRSLESAAFGRVAGAPA